MKHAAFFNGIGGFQIAAAMMGWENVMSCEIDPFFNKVTKYHFPNCIQHGDIRTTDFTIYRGQIGILSGGFPCQGFSLAGKRLGTDDDRYLWPEMLRAIREIKPPVIVGENVTGILSMEDKSGIWKDVFPTVEDRKIIRYQNIDLFEALYTRQSKMLIASICEDLESEGYEVQPIVIPAASVRAPHRRERIWMLAYSSNYGSHGTKNGQGNRKGNDDNKTGKETIIKPAGCSSEATRETIANSISHGFERERKLSIGGKTRQPEPGILQQDASNSECIGQQGPRWPIGSGDTETLGNWKASWSYDDGGWPTQSPVCSRNDGFPDELDGITFSKWRQESIKAAGNAIVPQVAYEIFKAIEKSIPV